MRQVYIAGVGSTRFGRHPESSLVDLAVDAIEDAIKDLPKLRSRLSNSDENRQSVGTDCVENWKLVLSKLLYTHPYILNYFLRYLFYLIELFHEA